MTTSAHSLHIEPALATSVRFTRARLFVALSDGREISVPLSRFPRLRGASESQRRNWKITAFGTGIRWTDIDEDIGVAGLLGIPEELVDEAAGFTIHRP
jgi:hypothetical protein